MGEHMVDSDWARENKRGRAYANDVIEIIHSQQNPTYLGKAVKRMIVKGEYGGFEVGFFHQIAERTA